MSSGEIRPASCLGVVVDNLSESRMTLHRGGDFVCVVSAVAIALMSCVGLVAASLALNVDDICRVLRRLVSVLSRVNCLVDLSRFMATCDTSRMLRMLMMMIDSSSAAAAICRRSDRC